jgi:hypothetical protein
MGGWGHRVAQSIMSNNWLAATIRRCHFTDGLTKRYDIMLIGVILMEGTPSQ